MHVSASRFAAVVGITRNTYEIDLREQVLIDRIFAELREDRMQVQPCQCGDALLNGLAEQPQRPWLPTQG